MGEVWPILTGMLIGAPISVFVGYVIGRIHQHKIGAHHDRRHQP